MAATAITNIVVPTIFSPYVVEKSATLSNILSSGIAQRLPAFDELAGSKGKNFELPYFNDLSGDDEVLGEGSGNKLTVNNITAEQETAVKLMRGKAFGATDLAAAVTGEDIMAGIGDMVATYWSRKTQSALVNILKGLFDDNAGTNDGVLFTNHTNDQGSTDITSDMVIDTTQKLGDNADKLSGIIMHSAVYAKLQKDSLISFIRDADNNIMFSTYLGKRVIVDDSVETSGSGATTQYRSYLFAPGAFAYGIGAIDNATEVDRDTLAGEDILINRQHIILHPRGCRWTGSPSGASPTNAELATSTNWSLVFADENIGVVCLIAGV
jgi:hypothetical protein